MKNTIKGRLEELEQQLSSRTDAVSMIIIDVVDASENGPQMAPPAGYNFDYKGARHFLPGTSERAVAAANELIDQVPRVRGVVRPVPVLIACLEAPTND
jgi:hypothetical protein